MATLDGPRVFRLVVATLLCLLAVGMISCENEAGPQTSQVSAARVSPDGEAAGRGAGVDPGGVGVDRAPIGETFVSTPEVDSITDWITGLEAPWSLVFLTPEEALVSERPGRIRLIRKGKLQEEAWARVKVATGGERGLMGLAVHPAFPGEPYVYAMYSATVDGRDVNRIVRFRHEGARGVDPEVIVDQIPGAALHDGGRIAFGPDGKLYVATGDAGEGSLSQSTDSLAGKILRLNPDGGIPEDNPIPDSPVFAAGLRNPQGIAWHPANGAMIVSDHGPTGENGWKAHDEVNHVVAGGNYGWPEVIGASVRAEFRDPLVVWTGQPVPPSGMTFRGDDLLLATLDSEALVRVPLRPASEGFEIGRVERLFARAPREGRFGRLRDATLGPDGALYLLTSNRDGRGRPIAADDRIVRIEGIR